MSYGLVQTVAPTVEPITVAEAKLWCRQDASVGSAEDAIFSDLIEVARRRVERNSYRQLITATWQLTLDSFFDLEPRSRWTLNSVPGQEDLIPQLRGIGIFSAGTVIRLLKSPLQATGLTVAYVDAAGTTQTLDSSLYLVDTANVPGRIAPAYGHFWPVTRRQIAAVTITFKAGYGDAASNVPADVKMAMKRIVGLYYANREVDVADPKIEEAVDAIIFQFWTGEYAA